MKFKRQSNGLMIPNVIAKPMTNTQIHEIYETLHCCCPKCGSQDIETTCMGYYFTSLETACDRNRASCVCGWIGILHDLTEKPKNEL